MSFTKLSITNFRNFTTAYLEALPQGFNLLYGINGSGKTSLLEAIYYLSYGKSFLSNLSSRVIKHSADKLILSANINREASSPIISAGIERTQNGKLTIKIAGNEANTVAELAALNPTLLINSQSFCLLDGGPAFRRKLIDWGGFHKNPDYLRSWRQCMLALKQRNAALRQKRHKAEIKSWDLELIEKTEVLHKYRLEYVNFFIELFNDLIGSFLQLQNLKLEYFPGWDSKESYASVLCSAYERDFSLGRTHFGPHRGDLSIKINDIPAKDILSRGQQKLFVCAMILAQGMLLKSLNKKPIYLIDDLPAELDSMNRRNLIKLLSEQNTQVFVTAVEHTLLQKSFADAPMKMFHVEHGTLRESSVNVPA